jgi:putative transposase
MTNDNDYRRGRHCVFALHAHLVFVTKYRRKVFSKDMLDDMRGVFASVCSDFEAELIEMDGEDDHVHLLVNYPPKIPLTKLVNSLKGVSSRRMRQMHPTLRPRYRKGVLWSPSYFAASCGGAPISIIRQYIERQRNPQSDSYRANAPLAHISGVKPRSLLR